MGFDREKRFTPQVLHRKGAVAHPEHGTRTRTRTRRAWNKLPLSYMAVSAVCSSSVSCVAAFVTRRKSQMEGGPGGRLSERQSQASICVASSRLTEPFHIHPLPEPLDIGREMLLHPDSLKRKQTLRVDSFKVTKPLWHERQSFCYAKAIYINKH